MANQLLGNVFKDMTKSAHTALRSMSKLNGQSQDDELRFYNRLNQDAIQKMMNEFGAESTMQYIKTMETKRLMEK